MPDDFISEIGPQIDGGHDVFFFPPRLPVGALRGVLPRQVWSTSFRFRSWVPHSLTFFGPLTILASQPGVIHVAIDASTYYGSHLALDFLREQARLAGQWFNRTANERIIDALYPWLQDNPDLIPADGNVRVIIEVPPGNLTDP